MPVFAFVITKPIAAMPSVSSSFLNWFASLYSLCSVSSKSCDILASSRKCISRRGS